MGTIRKQSIQATAILILGAGIGLVLRLYIFTKYLKLEEIGLLFVLLDVANLFAAFIPLGSPSIYVKYLSYFKSDPNAKPKGLFSWGLIASTIGFIAFLVLFLISRESLIDYYSNRAPMFARYIWLVVPLVFARVVYALGSMYANALKKNIFPLVMKEIVVRVLTGLIVILFAWQFFNLTGLVVLYVSIYFITGAVSIIYLQKLGALDFSFSRKQISPKLSKEMISFGLFTVLTSAGDVIIRGVDNIMIGSLKGLSATGVYSIAFFIGQIIEMPRKAISQITAPFVAEASAEKNMEKISSLYHKSSINQFIVGSILLICVWTNIDSVLELIGSDYKSGKYVVLFIGVAKLFDMSMGINGNIIQNSKHYRFNFYSAGLLAILGVTTNLILIPRLGINGAAIASLVSISLINIIKSVYIRVKFGLHPFNLNSGKALIIATLTYLVAIALPDLDHPLLNIIFKGGISSLLFVILILSLKVSEDMNQMYINLMKRILKALK